jgi:radical SAM-linked protein
MRYTGHLDLHKTWERTLRRAGLPLAYSQGFSPHPRINLASALPLGFTGEAEVIDVWLEEELPVETVMEALRKAAPPGIQVQYIQVVDPHAPSLQTDLQASEYAITLLEPPADLDARLQAVLQSPSLPRQRRDRSYDLRPLILELQRLPDDPQGCPRLLVHLAAQASATGRPEEVAAELGAAPEAIRAHRTRLIFRT